MVLTHLPRGMDEEVCMTNTVSLRSRVKGNFQARFWRAAALARESLTLIHNAAINILAHALKQTGYQCRTVGHTETLNAWGEKILYL